MSNASLSRALDTACKLSDRHLCRMVRYRSAWLSARARAAQRKERLMSFTSEIQALQAEAWERGYRDAMHATVGLQGKGSQGASFPADWEQHNPFATTVKPPGVGAP